MSEACHAPGLSWKHPNYTVLEVRPLSLSSSQEFEYRNGNIFFKMAESMYDIFVGLDPHVNEHCHSSLCVVALLIRTTVRPEYSLVGLLVSHHRMSHKYLPITKLWDSWHKFLFLTVAYSCTIVVILMFSDDYSLQFEFRFGHRCLLFVWCLMSVMLCHALIFEA